METTASPAWADPNPLTAAGDLEHLKTLEVLTGMAHGSFGRIEASLLARHVLAVTAAGDWPIRRAAMEALMRRWSFARRDRLRVAARPDRGALGLYATRRAKAGSRPYHTQLLSLSPLRASCDCPDFPHSSLGACKHVLVVLDALHSRPRKLAAARGEEPATPATRLGWDPVRPLVGTGDWLERVVWQRPAQGARLAAASKRIERWFVRDGDGSWKPRSTFPDQPAKRLELVSALLRFVQQGGLERKLARGSVEAALLPLLQAEQARLTTGAGLTRGEVSGLLRGMRRKLYPYQRQSVDRFLSSGRLLLADDMGLGKTAQAIACCHVLYGSQRVRRGLLIMPASLKSQWLREWQSFSGTPITLVEGSPTEREAIYRGCRKGFLILNYEQLLRDLPAIQRFAPEVVVLDEAQRIKNWQTKTSMTVKRLDPRYRLVLTGTPMENRLEELASIMQWVERPALEPAWRLVPWHVSELGARNLHTLRSRLQGSMLRRVRQEVLDQLPPRTDSRVPLELTREQAAEHLDYSQPIAQLVSIAQRRPLTQREFLRLMSLLTSQRMICNGLALAHFGEVWPRLESSGRPTDTLLKGLFSPKLIELRELVGTLAVEQGRRIVIFSQWRRMLQLAHWAIADVLADAGLRGVFFTGRESQKRRTANVIDFHDDDAARVLFASDAGGVGLNLQHAASCCINLELPWNPAVLEQRIGRIYRLGQTEPVEVYNLVSEGGIESRIATLVGNKRALFDGVFDGDSDEVLYDESGSFMERIEQVLEPRTSAIDADGADDEDGLDGDGLDGDGLDGDGLDAPEAQRPVETGTAARAQGRPAAEASAADPGLPSAAQFARLAAQLEVRVQPDGGLQLNAPPEAAAALAGLLSGLAAQLQATASPQRSRE